ncbi:MAG TPA: NAD(P)-dependent oxidoreductase [Syntrophales bacterium]|nr:NAD(P)-dependent oxidoreductase [Syntrophales bacterium]
MNTRTLKKAVITCPGRITHEALCFLKEKFELAEACDLPEEELASAVHDAALLVMGGDEKITQKVHRANPGLRKIFLGVDPVFAFDPEVMEHDRSRNLLFLAEGGIAAVASTTVEEMTDPVLLKSRLAKSFLPIPESNLAEGLRYQRVSVIGAGRIGKSVMEKLAGRCGEIAYYDPKGRSGGNEPPGLRAVKELAPCFERDIVTVHLALVPGQTENMIGYAELSRLRPNGLLINNARSQLIEPAGLLRFLRERTDALYVCDVFYVEGGELRDTIESGAGLFRDIFSRPNFLYTRHLAAMRPETYEEYGRNMIRIIKEKILQ